MDRWDMEEEGEKERAPPKKKLKKKKIKERTPLGQRRGKTLGDWPKGRVTELAMDGYIKVEGGWRAFSWPKKQKRKVYAIAPGRPGKGIGFGPGSSSERRKRVAVGHAHHLHPWE